MPDKFTPIVFVAVSIDDQLMLHCASKGHSGVVFIASMNDVPPMIRTPLFNTVSHWNQEYIIEEEYDTFC